MIYSICDIKNFCYINSSFNVALLFSNDATVVTKHEKMFYNINLFRPFFCPVSYIINVHNNPIYLHKSFTILKDFLLPSFLLLSSFFLLSSFLLSSFFSFFIVVYMNIRITIGFKNLY